jgi:hypothetical protein
MTTGFVTQYGGATNDLDAIFHAGSTPGATGLISGYRGNNDLASLFDPLDAGARLGYNTGFVALDGRDLADWFCAAGTRVADWPVGGGFLLFQNGSERLVFPGVTALTGRMSWLLGADGSDGAYGSNLIADRVNACPGVSAPQASLWQDFGGYQRGVTRRLPLGSVIRFEFLTINLAGVASWEMNVVPGEQIPGWIPTQSGSPPFCGFTSPFLDDSPNLFDFSPAINTWYGAFCPYLMVINSQNWVITVSATFCCNVNNGTLNEQRIYVSRIA